MTALESAPRGAIRSDWARPHDSPPLCPGPGSGSMRVRQDERRSEPAWCEGPSEELHSRGDGHSRSATVPHQLEHLLRIVGIFREAKLDLLASGELAHLLPSQLDGSDGRVAEVLELSAPIR
jgi:hypothetical protein